MSAEWTITGLTYDRDKAERRVDGKSSGELPCFVSRSVCQL